MIQSSQDGVVRAFIHERAEALRASVELFGVLSPAEETCRLRSMAAAAAMFIETSDLRWLQVA